LNEADFVSVCVGFDIVTCRDRQGKTIHQVHLTMEHVLLLASAAVIPKVSPSFTHPSARLLQSPQGDDAMRWLRMKCAFMHRA
jgi:hypothetical protein